MTDVSRETSGSGSVELDGSGVAIEPRPHAVASLFGEAWKPLDNFAHDLATRGEELGLIGPREAERIWSRHILNCGVLSSAIGREVTSVADVGSGAGLPGLVLALIRPEIQFVLIEPMERRAKWLLEEADRLGAQNVTVVRARAQEVADQLNVQVVTARAVSATATLIPMCVPLLHGCGELLLMKGQHVADELKKAAKVIRKLHLQGVRIEQIAPAGLETPTTVLRCWIGRNDLSETSTEEIAIVGKTTEEAPNAEATS